MQKYFGISFQDIFNHPTFLWAIEKNQIWFSKENIEFIKNRIYPACIPLELLPSDIIKEKEKIYQDKKEINPHAHYPAIRTQEYYNLKFGDGRYESKFGKITPTESNAEPWPGSKL